MTADTSGRKHEAAVAAATAASAKSMSEGGDGDVRGDSVRHLCRSFSPRGWYGGGGCDARRESVETSESFIAYEIMFFTVFPQKKKLVPAASNASDRGFVDHEILVLPPMSN